MQYTTRHDRWQQWQREAVEMEKGVDEDQSGMKKDRRK